MKTNKIYFALLALAALVLGSCSEDYLNRDPIGSSLTETQYQNLPNKLEGSLRGVYSLMYEYDDHDAFGQRSIDMYGDLLCGDMALTSQTYGWFYTDESSHTRQERSGWLWYYYYHMLHNINSVIRATKQGTTLLDTIAAHGLPNDELCVVNTEGDTVYTYSENEAQMAIYYAQALGMRGYVYSGLIRFFCPSMAHIYQSDFNIVTYPAFPYYNEDNMDEAQPLMSLDTVYRNLENDLKTAIAYFDAFKSYHDGSQISESKLEVNINVARGMLAYSYLNKAYLSSMYDYNDPLVQQPMQEALKYAQDIITSGAYSIIPNKELTSTGFNDVTNSSWIWGENVTVETATGLASFWGQVDIHSYSYAWSGDTKVIDEKLYEAIPSWDGRSLWFNDGSKNPTFKLCPDGKFFSAKSPNSTAADDIDREWLSDNVFMRIESIYLIAAEASYFLGDMTGAVNYLDAILSERLNPNNIDAATEYATFKGTLSNPDVFAQELYRNWRVEMWGEGYGLQTFRRLNYLYKNDDTGDKIKLGGNHVSSEKSGKTIEYEDETLYTMSIPSSESTYNPHMHDD